MLMFEGVIRLMLVGVDKVKVGQCDPPLCSKVWPTIMLVSVKIVYGTETGV